MKRTYATAMMVSISIAVLLTTSCATGSSSMSSTSIADKGDPLHEMDSHDLDDARFDALIRNILTDGRSDKHRVEMWFRVANRPANNSQHRRTGLIAAFLHECGVGVSLNHIHNLLRANFGLLTSTPTAMQTIRGHVPIDSLNGGDLYRFHVQGIPTYNLTVYVLVKVSKYTDARGNLDEVNGIVIEIFVDCWATDAANVR